MVDEHSDSAGSGEPCPYDLIRLVPGDRFGVDPATLPTVADTVESTPGALEVHHRTDHPAQMDRAAAVTIGDGAVVVRINGTTAHTWSPHP